MDQSTFPELPIIGATESETPVSNPNRRLPRWLKRQIPKGNVDHMTSSLLEELGLETVCDNAKCPNRMECYSQKTATFMIGQCLYAIVQFLRRLAGTTRRTRTG